MTKDEALRLALDALECWQRNEDCNEPMSKIMGAIKAALEAKGEPVAYINIEERKLEWANKYMSWDTPTVVNLPRIPLYTQPKQEQDCMGWFVYDTGLRLWFEANKGDDGAIPLYKDPPQRTWVGLTEEDDIDWDGTGNLKQLVEAIEAKLKDKNDS